MIDDNIKGKVRVFKDDASEWRWTKKALNGEPIGDSSEGYVSKHHAIEMAVAEAGSEYKLVVEDD